MFSIVKTNLHKKLRFASRCPACSQIMSESSNIHVIVDTDEFDNSRFLRERESLYLNHIVDEVCDQCLAAYKLLLGSSVTSYNSFLTLTLLMKGWSDSHLERLIDIPTYLYSRDSVIKMAATKDWIRDEFPYVCHVVRRQTLMEVGQFYDNCPVLNEKDIDVGIIRKFLESRFKEALKLDAFVVKGVVHSVLVLPDTDDAVASEKMSYVVSITRIHKEDQLQLLYRNVPKFQEISDETDYSYMFNFGFICGRDFVDTIWNAYPILIEMLNTNKDSIYEFSIRVPATWAIRQYQEIPAYERPSMYWERR